MQTPARYECVLDLRTKDHSLLGREISCEADSTLCPFLPGKCIYSVLFYVDRDKTGWSSAKVTISEPHSKMGMSLMLAKVLENLETEGFEVDNSTYEASLKALVPKLKMKYHPEVDYFQLLTEYCIPKLSTSTELKHVSWRGKIYAIGEKIIKEIDEWLKEPSPTKNQQTVQSYLNLLKFVIGKEYLEKRSRSIIANQRTEPNTRVGQQLAKDDSYRITNRAPNVNLYAKNVEVKPEDSLKQKPYSGLDAKNHTASISSYIDQISNMEKRPQISQSYQQQSENESAQNPRYQDRFTHQLSMSNLYTNPTLERDIVGQPQRTVAPLNIQTKDVNFNDMTATFASNMQPTRSIRDNAARRNQEAQQLPLKQQREEMYKHTGVIRAQRLIDTKPHHIPTVDTPQPQSTFQRVTPLQVGPVDLPEQPKQLGPSPTDPSYRLQHDQYQISEDPFQSWRAYSREQALRNVESEERNLWQGPTNPEETSPRPEMFGQQQSISSKSSSNLFEDDDPFKTEDPREYKSLDNQSFDHQSEIEIFDDHFQRQISKEKVPDKPIEPEIIFGSKFSQFDSFEENSPKTSSRRVEKPKKQANSKKNHRLHKIVFEILNSSPLKEDQKESLVRNFLNLLFETRSEFPASVNSNCKLLVDSRFMSFINARREDELASIISLAKLKTLEPLWFEVAARLVKIKPDFLNKLCDSFKDHQLYLAFALKVLEQITRSISDHEEVESVIELIVNANLASPNLLRVGQSEPLVILMFEAIESIQDTDLKLDSFMILVQNFNSLPANIQERIQGLGKIIQNQEFGAAVRKIVKVYYRLSDEVKQLVDKHCVPKIKLKDPLDLFKVLLNESRLEDSKKRTQTQFLEFLLTEKSLVGPKLNENYATYKTNAQLFLDAFSKGRTDATMFSGLNGKEIVQILNFLLRFKTHPVEQVIGAVSDSLSAFARIKMIEEVVAFCQEISKVISIPFVSLQVLKELPSISKQPLVWRINDLCSLDELANCLKLGSLLTSPFVKKLIISMIKDKVKLDAGFNKLTLEGFSEVADNALKNLTSAFNGFTPIPEDFLNNLGELVGSSSSKFYESMSAIFPDDSKKLPLYWNIYLINLFIQRKVSIEKMLKRIADILSKAGLSDLQLSYKYKELVSKHQRPPRLGETLQADSERLIADLLQGSRSQDMISSLLSHAATFIDPQTKETVRQMVVDGELANFNISLEDYRFAKTFFNAVEKTLKDAANRSPDQFLSAVLTHVRGKSKREDIDQTLAELEGITGRLYTCLERYANVPGSEKNVIGKILKNSTVCLTYDASANDYDVNIVVYEKQEKLFTMTWPQLEESKIKLVVGGKCNELDDEINIRQDFLQLCETIYSMKKSMQFIYNQCEIYDLNRAILSHLQETSKETYLQNAKVSLERIEVQCATTGLSANSTEAIEIVQAALHNLVSATKDPSARRQHNQSRLRLYLSSQQKQLLCQKLLQRSEVSSRNFDQVAGLLRFATGFRFECYQEKVQTIIEKFSKEEPIYLADLLEKLSAVIFNQEIQTKLDLKGRVTYSFYTSRMTECLLVHLAKYNTSEAFLLNQILMCTPVTSSLDVIMFLDRALTDPDQTFYYLVDCHLLEDLAAKTLIEHLKFILSDSRNFTNDQLLLLLESDSSLARTLASHPEFCEQLSPDQLAEARLTDRSALDKFEKLKRSLAATVVTSPIAGLGKSLYVKNSAKEKGLHLVEILLAGETGADALERRLELLADFVASNPNKKFGLLVRLDGGEVTRHQTAALNQLLLSLTLLRVVPFRQSFLFLDGLASVWIEVADGLKTLLPQISISRLGDRHECKPFSFDSIDCELLQGSKRIVDIYCAYWYCLSNPSRESSRNTIIECQVLLNSAESFCKRKVPEGLLNDASTLKKCLKGSFDHLSKDLDGKVDYSNYSYSQLVAFVQIVAHQVVELDKISALNPDIYSEIPYQKEARAKLFKMVFVSNFVSVFSISHYLRDESKTTMQVMKNVKDRDSSKTIDEVLKEYQLKVKAIPSWEHTIQKNKSVFARNGSLKLLSQDEMTTGCQLSKFLRYLQMVEGSYKRSDTTDADILEMLIEGLDLEVLLRSKNDPEYLKFLEDPANKCIKKPLVKFLEHQAANFRGKGYVVTKDNYLKLMMLVQRADYGVPVILMGATGCGKTFLVDFAVTCLLRDTFVLIGLHPGKSEADLIAELNRAIDLAEKCFESRRVWVLFDEFNTSPLQALISEIMLERRATFSSAIRPIPRNVVFVAACNPYKVEGNLSSVGLVTEVSKTLLAHRVYPIPDRLLALVWDFGQLQGSTEEAYISSMIALQHKANFTGEEKQLIPKIIICSQKFIREKEGNSSVSLRDVSRFLSLLTYSKDRFDDFTTSLAVVTALSYLLRIDDPVKRADLDKSFLSIAKFSIAGKFDKVCDQFASAVAELGLMPGDVALNRPLKENLFSIVLTQAARVPIVICGKPGTSKTLSTMISQAVFRASTQTKAKLSYLRDLPDLVAVNFSGSQSTTCAAIQACHTKAEALASQLRHSQSQRDRSTLVSVFFDELGLAEIADDNPLKVLHQILEPETPNIGFVGVSNWRLDLSKMNRVVYVSRPDPDMDDVFELFKTRVTASRNPTVSKIAKSLPQAYADFRALEIQKLERHANFHGSRDVYCAVTQLLDFTEKLENIRDPASLGYSLEVVASRNFNGVELDGKASSKVFLDLLHRRLNLVDLQVPHHQLSPLDAIFHNLSDPDSRHLMLFCENSQVEEILLDEVRRFSTIVLGKPDRFVKRFDRCSSHEEELEVLNSLAVMVTQGYTVVMKRLDAVYGCLYELFNQRFETRRGVSGCYLIYDSHRQWIPVHRDFKCVVLMDDLISQSSTGDLERTQQPPFLNRFEKQLVKQSDLLNDTQTDLLVRLQREYIKTKRSLPNILVHNMSRELILSLVMHFTKTGNFKDNILTEPIDERYCAYLFKSLKEINIRSQNAQKMDETNTDYLPANFIKESSMFGIILDNIINELASLYSRNMILEKYLSLAESRKDEYLAFKEKFLATHKYDSLEEMLDELCSPFCENLCTIIYTFSEQFVAAKILKNRKDSVLLQVSNLVAQKRRDANRTIEQAFKDSSNSVVVVQVSSSVERSSLREFSSILAASSNQNSKACLLMIHVSNQTKTEPQDYYTGIRLVAAGWAHKVIDNLEGCGYEAFFDSLTLKCSEFLMSKLENGAKSFESSYLCKQLKESLIEKISTTLLTKCSSSSAVKDLPKIVDSFRRDDKAMSLMIRMVAEHLAKASNISIDRLILQDNLHRAEIYNDVEQYVAVLVKDLAISQIDEVVRKIDSVGGLTFLIRLSCIADEKKRKTICDIRWVPVLRGLSETSTNFIEISDIAHGIYSNIVDSFTTKDVESRLAQKTTELRAQVDKVKEEKRDPKQSQTIKNLVIDFTKIEISEDDKEFMLPFEDFGSLPVDSAEEICLVAIYLIDKRRKNLQQEELSYIETKVLIEIGMDLLKMNSSSQITTTNLTLVEGILALLLIAQVYHPELSSIKKIFDSNPESLKMLDIVLLQFKQTYIFNLDGFTDDTVSLLHAVANPQLIKSFTATLRLNFDEKQRNLASRESRTRNEICLAFVSAIERYVAATPKARSTIAELIESKQSIYDSINEESCDLYLIVDLMMQSAIKLLVPPLPSGLDYAILPEILNLATSDSSEFSIHSTVLKRLASLLLTNEKLASVLLRDVVKLERRKDSNLLRCLVDAAPSHDSQRIVDSLRRSHFAFMMDNGCIDYIREPKEVLSCDPKDFDVQESIAMKVYLEYCCQQTNRMDNIVKHIEKGLKSRKEDPITKLMLRFIFKRNIPEVLSDEILSSLGLDRESLNQIAVTSSKSREDVLSGLYFLDQREAVIVTDKIAELKGTRSRSMMSSKESDFWMKYVIVILKLREYNRTLQIKNNAENYLRAKESKSLNILLEIIDSTYIYSTDIEPLSSLGLLLLILEGLEKSLQKRGPTLGLENEVSLLEKLLEEVRDLPTVFNLISLIKYSLDFVNMLSVKPTRAKMREFSAKFNETTMSKDKEFTWTYFVWLQRIAIILLDKTSLLNAVIKACKDIESQVTPKRFDEFNCLLNEVVCSQRPKSASLLEFCKSDDIENTSIGRELGAHYCKLGKFLELCDSPDLERVLKIFSEQKHPFVQTLLAYSSKYDELALYDDALLSLANFSRSFKETVRPMQDADRARILSSDLEYLIATTKASSLKTVHSRMFSVFSKNKEAFDKLFAERSPLLKAKSIELKQFLLTTNPRLKHLAGSQESETCLLNELIRVIAELRNGLFEEAAKSLGHFDHLTPYVVKLTDFIRDNTFDSLKVGDVRLQDLKASNRNPITAFIMNQFVVDGEHSVKFDFELMAIMFFKRIVNRLGKVLFVPLFSSPKKTVQPSDQKQDLDTQIKQALSKLGVPAELVSVTSKYQKEVVAMFETAKGLPQQDKIAASLKLVTGMCVKVVLKSDEARPSSCVSQLVPLDSSTGLATWTQIYDSTPAMNLGILRKVQLALAYRESRAAIDRAENFESSEKKLQEVIRVNRIAKTSLTFAIVDVCSEVARLLENDDLKIRESQASLPLDSLLLDTEVKTILHGWLERITELKNLKLADAIWIVAAMETIRDKMIN